MILGTGSRVSIEGKFILFSAKRWILLPVCDFVKQFWGGLWVLYLCIFLLRIVILVLLSARKWIFFPFVSFQVKLIPNVLKVSAWRGAFIKFYSNCMEFILYIYLVFMLCLSVVSNSLQPHGLLPIRLLCPWDSPGKNTGMGCHLLLQGNFPTRDQTWVFNFAGRLFIIWATREAQMSSQ